MACFDVNPFLVHLSCMEAANQRILQSLRNRVDDDDENVVLHALHERFSFLYVSLSFSSYQRRLSGRLLKTDFRFFLSLSKPPIAS